ncbi:hypothetical protein CYLTODRAFT_453551 [Cylindrobasidium torrendii FP15055 ss-10]|uniref:F-box domain-containing protein n=1 Tax=Cylindrobasidium torrendii FP15055 ss-10 TaxID=1314674 RepID=A0A0D7BDY7_9AGAR|nr:hypothetical protein CYLTODRAFT_453551 [Cylindrobasidium torrendii FP15055 ss-10]
MPNLPVELKLQILDELDQTRDGKTDPFCGIALVWPDVLFEIRRYRFHTIRLRRIGQARTMIALIQSAPSIAEIVRTLRLPSSNIRIHQDPVIKQLFSMLPLVSSIHLHSIFLRVVGLSNNTDALLALPPTVTNVNVEMHCRELLATAALSRIFAILNAFQGMQRLELRYSNKVGRDRRSLREYSQTNTIRSFKALREINISAPELMGDPLFVDYLAEKVVFEDLASLVVVNTWFDREVCEALNKLMRRWKRSLRDVHLAYDSTQDLIP